MNIRAGMFVRLHTNMRPSDAVPAAVYRSLNLAQGGTLAGWIVAPRLTKPYEHQSALYFDTLTELVQFLNEKHAAPE